MQRDLTQGNVLHNLLLFSIPYLLSCFLQTFYGLADLFITGRFNGAAAISAVSIGSQVTHMLTVVVVGLTMGTTVMISRAVGSKDKTLAARVIGGTVLLFTAVAVLGTAVLLFAADGIISVLSTPAEAVDQTRSYLMICFLGCPFITAYNVLSSIFRGLGDSKSPMYFIAVAGVVNILLDVIFIGPLAMGAAGAALGTVLSQAVSVVLSLVMLRKKGIGVPLTREDFRPRRKILTGIAKVGLPIAVQDGFIQISFIVITIIANRRGLVTATGVGIVEKVISFLFLVPSAMLSSVSALTAQNIGAGRHDQGLKVLRYGMTICVGFGCVAALVCQIVPEQIVALFANGDTEVIRMGAQYLRTYVTDCIFAGVNFCFCGYFCAYSRSFVTFLWNFTATVLIRIPGAYLASVFFPDTLYAMGLASPAGSLFASVVGGILFAHMLQKRGRQPSLAKA